MRKAWRSLSAGVLLVAAQCPAAARAEPPGDSALKQARLAWDGHDFAAAEMWFKEALEKGGLPPPDVLDAYVRLGAARTLVGKKDAGLAAFRAAAAIDPQFSLPPEAGKKAAQAAAQARKDTQKLGALALKAAFPQKLTPGAPFKVEATLDDAHTGVVSKIALFARDPQNGKEFAQAESPAPRITFDVPGNVSVAGGSLTLRIDALDPRENRLASVEERVPVQGGVAPVGAGSPSPPASPQAPEEKEVSRAATSLPKDPPGGDRPKSSFWSTPWPFVVGGAVLLAGGAALYFALKGPDAVDVNVSAPGGG